MNGVDVIVVAVVGLSAIIAFLRGFVREMLTVGSWLGATLVTLHGFAQLRPLMGQWIQSETVAIGATIAVLFFGSLILFSVLSHQLAKLVHGSALSAIDRSLGVAFGVVRGGILVSLAYMLFVWLQPNGTPMLDTARTLPMMQRGAEILRDLAPADIGARLPLDNTPVRPILPGDAKAMAPGGQIPVSNALGTQRTAGQQPAVIGNQPAAAAPAVAGAPDKGYRKDDRNGLSRTIELMDLARDAVDAADKAQKEAR
jgi:membrane protein required for colicin V production